MYRIMPKSECTLTTTIVGEWIIDEKDKKDVDDEMQLFQCAVRACFKFPKKLVYTVTGEW